MDETTIEASTTFEARAGEQQAPPYLSNCDPGDESDAARSEPEPVLADAA